MRRIILKKDDVVSALRAAKMAHKKWVGHAFSLVQGLPLEKSQVPLNATDCKFGVWFYTDGQRLKRIPGFDDIEDLHDGLRKIYMEVFLLIFREREASMWEKLFKIKPTVTKREMEQAKILYRKLEQHSKKLVLKLEQVERNIFTMTEKAFEQKLL
jgi:hypothetical protein